MSTKRDRRIFLGWEKPVVNGVVEHLVRDRDAGPGKPLDLQDVLIVVPTRQGGRRLREALARWCDERETAVVTARTVTPAFFLRNRSGPAGKKEAPSAVASGAWAELLMKIDLGEYPDLFPAGIPERDYAWALHAGNMMVRLRHTLADAGVRISDVPNVADAELEELARWQNMGKLEATYIAELDRLGYADPVLAEMERAKSPQLPDGVKHIVVAAVPAPTPLMLTALKAIETQLTQETGLRMEVLVHAPVSFRDWFDDWGRADPAKWCKAAIDIPEFEKNVRLAVNPEAQARLAGESIAESAGEIGPNDIAIGVPDRSVIPFLESHLGSRNLPAFDPSERAVSEHMLCRLLAAFCDLYTTRSYGAFSNLLRHAEVLRYFSVEHEVSTRSLLTALDTFQNFHLPMDFNDINTRFSGAHYAGPDEPAGYEALGTAIEAVRGWLDALDAGLDHGIRNLLKTVYGARKTIGDSPKEKELQAVADAVDRALRDCTEAAAVLSLDMKNTVMLFLERLAEEMVARERERTLIDLEGWLELPWNDAPLLIVTGMNEGSVPDSRIGDVFLPDRLRKAVNLPNDESRFARDAYLLTDMIRSRPKPGRVVLILGKFSAAGDPLKPSRLLFRCETELLARTEQLFGDVEQTQKNFPFNRSFLLDPTAPIGSDPKKLEIDHLSPSQFKTYLQCPFRYYLKKILRMEELSDDAAGLEAAEFGTVIHSVLEILAEEEELRACTNEKTLSAALHKRLDLRLLERFGKEPPLTVRLAASSAKQRLQHVARVQAEQAKQGWVILEIPEEEFAIEINGFPVTGRIDRIDRHKETGALRAVDYKTGRQSDPKKSHLGSSKNCLPIAKVTIGENGKKKEYGWTDLQLPIYSMMIKKRFGSDLPVKAAYFSLPRAASDTGLLEWEDLTEEIVEEAGKCAGRIIDAIKARQFWPPADSDPFETFDAIITNGLAETVDERKFKRFLGI